MSKFELFKGRDGQYYFRLKASNGQTIAQSEGYVSKDGALNGIRSVKENALIATISDLTWSGRREDQESPLQLIPVSQPRKILGSRIEFSY